MERDNDENMLEQFCATAAHELKAPLSSMEILMTTLKNEMSDCQSDEAPVIMKMMNDKILQMKNLIDRMLDLSKTCTMQQNFQRIELKQVIHNVFDEMRLLEKKRRITLKVDELPSIIGDPMMIQILFKNIIGNAIKYTRNKKNALISVSGETKDESVIITVKDNGAGFDEKYAQDIFEPFVRLHNQSEFEGNGIGLQISKRIMAYHSGYIQISGKMNEGTEVSLHFPYL